MFSECFTKLLGSAQNISDRQIQRDVGKNFFRGPKFIYFFHFVRIILSKDIQAQISQKENPPKSFSLRTHGANFEHCVSNRRNIINTERRPKYIDSFFILTGGEYRKFFRYKDENTYLAYFIIMLTSFDISLKTLHGWSDIVHYNSRRKLSLESPEYKICFPE